MEIRAYTANELFNNVSNILLDKEWHLSLYKFDEGPVYSEIQNANMMLINPTENLMNESYRKMPIKYAVGELLWYNSRNRSANSIKDFSKFWQTIADENGNVNSNYGWCIHDKFDFDQWDFVKRLLIKDPSTRQAVIHIKEPRNLLDDPTKDVNCTIALQFMIRCNKLDMIVTMRSNDVWLGLPYDVFNFTCMQIQMAMELNVGIGLYYHNSGSLHLYRKDYDKLIKNMEEQNGVR